MLKESEAHHSDSSVYVSLGNRLHIVDGMGSYIGFHRARFLRDARGHALSGMNQRRFHRLKTIYGTRARIGTNETQYRALRTLNRVSRLLMVSTQVRDRAAYLYKKILSEAHASVSNNNILLVAVCLLLAVREFGEDAPITLDEIADVFARCGHRVSVRAIVRQLLTLRSLTGRIPSARDPADYVPRIVSMLMKNSQVHEKTVSRGWDPSKYETLLRDQTLRLIRRIPSSKRGGRNPFIFAASAAYAADQLIAAEYSRRPILTQKLTSLATGVAEYSIRDHYGIIKRIVMSPIAASNDSSAHQL